MDGLWTEWYSDGQKKREEPYKDGDYDRYSNYWWYDNGQKENEGILKDGEGIKLIGKWNEDGSVRYD